MLRRIRNFAVALLAIGSIAPAAQAAELYLSGSLLQSKGHDEASGTIEVLPAKLVGGDGDSSVGYGVSLGFGFDFDEVLPKQWDAWGSAFRIEGEFVYGRDWDFVSNTRNGNPPFDKLHQRFFDQAKAWSLMPVNLYIDVPLRRPLSRIFGRVPRLEPFDFSFGFGAGISHVEIDAFDNTATARDQVYKFAFQANAMLLYEVNERTKIQFGYRYLSLGGTNAALKFDGTKINAGKVNLALTANEFVVSALYAFDQKPLAEMNIPWPRWLGGDGGANSPEPQKPKKPKKQHRWWPTWLGGHRSEP